MRSSAPVPSSSSAARSTFPRARDAPLPWVRAVLLAVGTVAAVAGQVVLAAVPLVLAPALWPRPVGERPPVARPVVWLSRAVVGVSGVLIVVGVLDEAAGPSRSGVWMQLAEVHADLVMTVLGLALAAMFVLAAMDASRRSRRLAGELLVVLLVQGAIGYASYFAGAPRGWALAHLAGAVVVWTAVLRLHRELIPRRAIGPGAERVSSSEG